MRELAYLIHDVRQSTDNTDENGVKDKEFIRYFQDGIRSIQAIVFKNNPLCSYFQYSTEISSPVAGTAYELPTDTYGDNAVSMVEVKSEASLTDDAYLTLERSWAEEQNTFAGWFTRNRTLVFTGRRDVPISYSARAWYFKRLPRWDKVWATVNGAPAGQVVTLTVADADFSQVDNYVSFLTPAGAVRASGLKYTITTATTITITGDISAVQSGDLMVMGKNTLLTVDLPDEVETYLLDYVAKRVAARNNYADSNKIEFFTSEAKADIISIFADVGQAQVRAPITDTGFMRI